MRSKASRAFRITGIVVSVLVVLLYVLLPGGFGLYASLGVRKAVGAPPRGFVDTRLTTADGVELAAWYASPRNGAAIILLHGGTGSREGVRAHARMLRRNGFGVLALDLRGHGESGGNANGFGWGSAGDIGAAVAFLRGKGVESIGGLGVSLGGEALLGAASRYPAIRAIASEGATHRCTGDYLALPSNRSLARSWTTRVMYSSVRLFTGDTPPVTITDSLRKARDTRYLLIAGGKVPTERGFNELFRKTAGSRAALWVVPGAGHTAGIRRAPEDYERRVIGFLRASLLGGSIRHGN